MRQLKSLLTESPPGTKLFVYMRVDDNGRVIEDVFGVIRANSKEDALEKIPNELKRKYMGWLEVREYSPSRLNDWKHELDAEIKQKQRWLAALSKIV